MKNQINGNRDLSLWSNQVNQQSNELIDLSLRIRERMEQQAQALGEFKRSVTGQGFQASIVKS